MDDRLLSRFFWVTDPEVESIHQRIVEVGELTFEQKENPRVTGEPYRFVQYYDLKNDCSAEVYWLDAKKKKLGDIRLSLSYTEKQLRSYNEETGFESGQEYTFTGHMSPFFRSVMYRAIGMSEESTNTKNEA